MHGFIMPLRRAGTRGRRFFLALTHGGRRSVVLGMVLLIGSTVTAVGTANTAPVFTSLTASPSIINEGQKITLNGTFTDPDTADAHGLMIYWLGDSANFKEKLELPQGQLSFQISHTYTDDLPPTSIKVVLFDRQQPIHSNDNIPGLGGDDTEHLPVIQVKNVAPRFVDSSVVGTASASGVVVEGDVVEPGADGLQVTGAVGNPIYPPGQIPMTCAIGKGERHFRCEHSHQPNIQARTYNVNLTLRDDDGGQDTHTMSVHFAGITRP